MKRFLALSIFILILSGCGQIESERTVKSFMSESSNLNVTNEYVDESLIDELAEKENELLNGMTSSLGLPNIDSIEEMEGYESLKNNLLELQLNLSYKFQKTNPIDNELVSVLINIEYIDIGDLVVESLNDVLNRNLLKVNSGEDLTGEDVFADIIELINKQIESVDINEMRVTKNAELKVHKVAGNWLISEMDDRVLNALTLGFSSHLDKLNNNFEEINANRVFLEIENNLRSILTYVEDVINDDEEVNYDNFIDDHSEELSNELSSQFELKVDVVNDVETNEGVYNVTKGENEDELSVILEVDGENYRFSKEIED